MRTMTHSPKTSTLLELGAEFGNSEADFGGKLKFHPPLGPHFRGEPNGASKLDWSVFTNEVPDKKGTQ